ncbi:MAG TPA: hypothetical protein VM074_00410 [Solimonas sp.]|nr:hypothetical protein [Solimonas sp.]
MTNTPITLAEHASAIRSLSPWVPLLAVAILFLGAGVDITSGHAVDPAIFGHGLLALFGLGLLATLAAHGRHQPMGQACFGLAALESACLVSWAWRYVPTTRGLVLASATIGALYVAGLLFHRQRFIEPEAGSGAWSVAWVLCIAAAVLVWGAVAAGYAFTGETRWPLAAWGALYAVLPFASRLTIFRSDERSPA